MTDYDAFGTAGAAEAQRRMLIDAWAVLASHAGVRLRRGARGDGPSS